MKENLFRRGFALLLAAALLIGYVPFSKVSAAANPDLITTVADKETLTRPQDIYGDNTQNAGKVTVGKSVQAADASGNLSVLLNAGTSYAQEVTGSDPDNFLITITQTAQVMGLASESAVPLDVVFVLDTSGSMIDGGVNRVTPMVEAANTAIATLMAANENNRIGVVAFSDNDEAYGWGEDVPPTTVLSQLAHYSDQGNTQAATNHLRIQNSNIVGRGSNAGRRNQDNGATNIQAGIIAGAKLLTGAADTTVTVDGKTVNRVPFLVILSDGQPTRSYSSTNWYNPTSTAEQGPGNSNSGDYAGNGFLAATAAAYYKGLITEHYFGTNASEENRCFIYTIGVELDGGLAEMTMDPKGNFVTGSRNSYYNSFNTAWNSYTANSSRDGFSVAVGANSSYKYTQASITATTKAVMGKSSTGAAMYEGGLAYNDDYFAADSADEIADAFSKVVSSIQLKAISSPTQITTTGEFSGYVTFYDTLGEYMELKKMHGIVANGNFYQGTRFTQLLMNPGMDASFDSSLAHVLTERLKLSGSEVTAASLMADARTNKTATGDTTNSFCWWGKEVDVNQEDKQMQVLGSAREDSIAYITDSQTAIPAGAEYVCRSYFFYGTASMTAPNPNHEYLYFVVRVQRSLEAPYQQTVVISAPASLLSMDKVYVTEDVNDDFRATVVKDIPARVVYEVGMRSDITPQNVSQIVSSDYAAEKPADGLGTANYDPETDTYYFFTNDWDRREAKDSHNRAMTKVTFDAASDNSFYTYQQDTQLLDSNHRPVNTAALTPGEYYYARTYYDWTGKSANADGSYPCDEKIAYIPVNVTKAILDDGTAFRGTDNTWYIREGAYTASTTTGTDDNEKADFSITGTAATVKSVRNTVDHANSHYTVLLGNNGLLTMKADNSTKTVSGVRPNTNIQLQDGSMVMIGDKLTYTIKVVNNGDAPANATVTDSVPKGTKFDSASPSATPDANGGLVWNLTNIPANSYEEVQFTVVVTDDIMEESFVSVDNTAQVTLSNGASYSTNTTQNPPGGKVVGDENRNEITGGVEVAQILTFRIRYANDTDVPADITITDMIPAGTALTQDPISDGGKLLDDGKTIQWIIEDVLPGRSDDVYFRVYVDASAKEVIENSATIKIGENGPTISTNPTQTAVNSGNLTISKTVVLPAGYETDNQEAAVARRNTEFTLLLRETGDDLEGTYAVTGNAGYDKVIFKAGKAYMVNAKGEAEAAEGITVKHGQSLTIKGLPANAKLSVEEVAVPGYTPAYEGLENTQVVVKADTAVEVKVTNTYAITPATFQLQGKKNISGILPQNITFTFSAQACDENGVPNSNAVIVTSTATVGPDKNEATFKFSQRSFSKPGEYYYLVKETQTAVTGVKYDETQYLLKVTVADNGLGQLSASYEAFAREGSTGTFSATASSSGVVFENAYKALPTAWTPQVTKTLTGRDLADGEFSFQVTENGTVVSVGQNNAGSGTPSTGTVTFRPITYTEAGTHTYKISEVKGSLPGVTYSQSSFTVIVEVKDDGTGRLMAYPKIVDSTAMNFKNSFEPTEVKVAFTGTKTLNGRALAAGEFSFQIAEKTSGKVVATGENAAGSGTPSAGAITFSPIGYKLADMANGNGGYLAEKTFTYEVSEVIPVELAKDPYMTYDRSKIEVQVKVTYNSTTGELKAEIANTSSAIAFTNTQNPSTVEVEPAGNKATAVPAGSSSQIPQGATFSFAVTTVGKGDEGTAGVEAAVGVGNANGQFTFTKLSYSKPGTYYYWIQETHAGQEIHGIKYDAAKYLMVNTVTQGAAGAVDEGKLSVTTKYYALKQDGNAAVAEDYTVEVNGVPKFSNEYAAVGQLSIVAWKELKDRVLKSGDFAFHLIRQDNGHEITGMVTTVDSNNKGKVEFATLHFDLSEFVAEQTKKTIHYVMSEVKGNLPGVIYDNTSKDVYVTIEHITEGQDAGTIKAYLSNSEGAPLDSATDTEYVFQNTYAPQDAAATITVHKDLSGRDLRSGEFSFELHHLSTARAGLVDTATNMENGTVTFQRSYYAATFPYDDVNKKGEVVVNYYIKETAGNLGGVDYDGKAYGVKVTVKNNTDTGSLEVVSVKYYHYDLTNGEFGQEIQPEDAVFTNEYHAKAASYTPEAHKELKNWKQKDNEFAFEVKEFDLSTGEAGNVVSTGLSKENGKVVFTAIPYSDRQGAGTTVPFYYEISEVKGNLEGVTYTDAKYYLQVNVTDDGAGNINTEGTYYAKYDSESKTFADPITDLSEIVFVNTYNVKDVLLNLEGTKKLSGRPIKDSEFDFAVKDEADTVITYGTNTGEKITFGTLSYSLEDLGGAKEKTFTYKISELVPSNAVQDGHTVIHTDTNEYTVTVKVTLDENGNLIAVPTYPQGGLVFTNTYTPKPVSVTLQAEKHLMGKKLQAEEFTFQLKDKTGKPEDEKKNDKDGLITFEPLKFTTIGTYEYTISELQATSPYGTYHNDSAAYKAVVEVTDNYTGALQAKVTYYKNGEPVTFVSFLNTYTPGAITEDLSVQIGAQKQVETPFGSDFKYTLEGGEFQFQVIDISGKEISKGENKADGTIKLDDFTFETAGTYNYRIQEVTSQKPGIHSDTRQWRVQIIVRVNEATGELYIGDGDVITRSLTNNAEKPVFVNNYAPQGVDVSFSATKTLTGRPLKVGEFQFQLMDGNTVRDTVTNGVNGQINFNLHITKPGVYTYQIVEVEGSDTTVGYSTNKATVTFTVTDKDLDGKLEATQPRFTAGSQQFENTYTAGKTNVTIHVEKQVNALTNLGYVLKGGEFTFQLIDGDGKAVEVSNDASGKVSFPLEFTDADMAGEDTKTFTYTVKEKPGNVPGITYDTKEYKIEVVVTDDYAGKLVAQVKYPEGTDGAVVFSNTYDITESAVVKITGTKTYEDTEGNALKVKEGEFSFGLYNEAGELQGQPVKNGADGSILFQLLCTKENIGTHTYIVKEIAGDDPQVTYDKTEYKLVVTVADDTKGKLAITYTVDGKENGTVDFKNVYAEPETPEMGDSFQLYPMLLVMAFSAAACAYLLLEIKRKRYVGKHEK